VGNSDGNGLEERSTVMANGGSHKPVPKDTKASANKGAESGKKETKK
jgi:hypothetical protein